MGHKPLQILLVDDDQGHVEAIHNAFLSFDKSALIEVATTLFEAFNVLERIKPDLVITDWVLPDGKGTDLLAFAKGKPMFPLIVVTDCGNEKTAVDAIKAGALDYVVKSPEVYADLIKKLGLRH